MRYRGGKRESSRLMGGNWDGGLCGRRGIRCGRRVGDLVNTRFHRDGTVTLWDVYAQRWERYRTVPDRVLASLTHAERERVLRHTAAK